MQVFCICTLNKHLSLCCQWWWLCGGSTLRVGCAAVWSCRMVHQIYSFGNCKCFLALPLYVQRIARKLVCCHEKAKRMLQQQLKFKHYTNISVVVENTLVLDLRTAKAHTRPILYDYPNYQRSITIFTKDKLLPKLFSLRERTLPSAFLSCSQIIL